MNKRLSDAELREIAFDVSVESGRPTVDPAFKLLTIMHKVGQIHEELCQRSKDAEKPFWQRQKERFIYGTVDLTMAVLIVLILGNWLFMLFKP